MNNDKERSLLTKAYVWIENNQRAWDYMVCMALKEVQAQRRVGMKWIIEETRKKDFATGDGTRFRINNTLSPCFARILMNQYPDVKQYIETRPAGVDRVL